MYYVYVLKLNNCLRPHYIGYSSDLRKRCIQHEKGEVRTTKNRNPELIYYEAYKNKYTALKREKSIKNSGPVYMSLMKRLKEHEVT